MKLMERLLCRGYLKSGVGWEEKRLDKNDVAKVGIAKVGPHPGSFKMDLGYLEMDRMEIPVSASHCRPGAGIGLMSTELPGFLLVFWGRVWSLSGTFITHPTAFWGPVSCLQKARSNPKARVSCLGSFGDGTAQP